MVGVWNFYPLPSWRRPAVLALATGRPETPAPVMPPSMPGMHTGSIGGRPVP
jgi:hypothetical protein